jgi:hypothetical protein
MTLAIGAIMIGSAVFFVVLAAVNLFQNRNSQPPSTMLPGLPGSR